MTALRRVRAADGGAAVVLTYHRIHDASLDPEQLCVAPSRFEEHVAAFAQRYTLLTAGDLFTRLSEGRALPRNGLVLTFDDGYSDVLECAAPVLERYDACGTVFVSSGFVDSKREMWWDALERVCLQPGVLPELLELDIDGSRFSAPLGDAAVLDGATAKSFAGWDTMQPPAHRREQLYLDLAARLHRLDATARRDTLDTLFSIAGIDSRMRPANRGLTADEVRRLAQTTPLEVGAHTVTHEALGPLDEGTQRREIRESKQALEEMTDSRVVSFSYPYGTAGTFTARTKALVREAGFLGAVTTRLGGRIPWGSVGRRTDRFEVPRTATEDVLAEHLVALIDKRLGLGSDRGGR